MVAAEDAPRKMARGIRPDIALIGLLPFVGFVTVFLLVPIGVTLWSTFHDREGTFTLASVQRLFQPQYLEGYAQTTILSAATAIVGGILGTVLAWAISTMDRPGWLRRLVVSFTPVASQFAGVPLAFAFVATLGAQGIVTVAVREMTGFNVTDAFRLGSLPGIALVYLYFQVPLMTVLMLPAISGIRAEWRESVESLGGTNARYVRTVLLPILAPTIGGALIILFANAFSAYATAYALTGGRANLVPFQIGFFLTGDVLSDPSFGAALSAGMMVVIAFAMFVRWLITRRATRWLR